MKNNLNLRPSLKIKSKIIRKSVIGLFAVFGMCCLLSPQDVDAAAIARPANNLGLISYWSFNEGTGTKATDLSGNGNDGTLTNMANPATAASGWGNGKLGKGLTFDGTNDYVDLGSMTATSSNFSACLWWNGIGGGAWAGPLRMSKSGQAGFQMSNETAGGTFYQPHLVVQNNSGSEILNKRSNVSYNYPFGGFKHFCWTWNGTTANLYVNGASVAISDGTASYVGGSGNFSIGRSGTGASTIGYVQGPIDEVRVYSRVLSSTEINSLYRVGSQKLKTGPSNNGLVGYWSFDDATGTKATDFSGNGNVGTLVGNPTWVNGKFGNALGFNGSTNYVNVGNNSAFSFESYNKFTISAWVRAPANYSVDGIIASKRTDSPATDWRGYELGVLGSTGKLYFVAQYVCCGGTTNMILSGSTNLRDGRWHHVTLTFDGQVAGTYAANVSLYVDGVAETKTVSSDLLKTGSILNSAPFMIGSKAGTADLPFNGTIDEVRIYNRALSTTEITNLYTSGAQKINASRNVTGSSLDSGLVGLWSFDGKDMSSATAFDRSGSGNNGTLTNGPVPTIGKMGQALSFDGVDDGVYVAKPTLPSTGFTISTWIKPASTLPSNSDFIGTFSGNGWLFRCSYINPAFLEFYNGATNYTTGAYVQTGIWQQAVVTYDAGGTYRIYYNGALVYTSSSGQGAPTSGPAANMTIGRLPDSGVYGFPGSIDEVRVYNRTLSSSEVLQLYNLGK